MSFRVHTRLKIRLHVKNAFFFFFAKEKKKYIIKKRECEAKSFDFF